MEVKPAKKHTLRRVAGPLHKCRCRRIIGVWRTQITTCLCGKRYQWAEPKGAVRTIVIGGEEKKKEEEPAIMKEEKK